MPAPAPQAHTRICPALQPRLVTTTAEEMDERLVQDVQSAAMFPLPFRVLFLLSSGILAWATNLHGLHHHAIDGPGVLHLDRPSLPTIRSPSSKLTPHPPPSYR